MYPKPTAAHVAETYGAAQGENPLASLVEVHDAMIAKLVEAQNAALDGRYEDRFTLTFKIGQVVEMLQLSLDREQGGEIASNLDQLYTYFGRRLTDFNIQNEPAICDELITNLAMLRDGWRHLLDGQQTMPDTGMELTSLSA